VVVVVGETTLVLPVPIKVPPQEPVYQYIIALDTEADKVDELPEHITDGVAFGEKSDGKEFTMTKVLPCWPQPQSL